MAEILLDQHPSAPGGQRARERKLRPSSGGSRPWRSSERTLPSRWQPATAGQGPSGVLGALSGKALYVFSCSLPWDPRDLPAHGDGQEAGPLHPAGTHQGRLELCHLGGQGSTTERNGSRRLPPPPLPLSPSKGRGGGTGDPQAPPPACARAGREGAGGQGASRHQTHSTRRRWNPCAGRGGSSPGRRRLPLSNNIGA